MSIAEDTIYDEDDLCEHGKIICPLCEETYDGEDGGGVDG